tara:strand:- start:2382 stop:3056 length:675 start_codon:yes stop_codon:yes gene_type:complete
MFQKDRIAELAAYAADSYSDAPVTGTLISVDNVQATLWDRESHVVLAFRGTEPQVVADVLTDLDVRKVDDNGGQTHAGFLAAYETIEMQLLDTLTSDNNLQGKALWITGHSMGGAIATIAAYRLGCSLCVTFGSPRVGDRAWARAFNNKMVGKVFRVVNSVDLVSRVPSFLRFRHVGIPVLLTSAGVWIQPGVITRMRNILWCLMTGRFGRSHSIHEYIRELAK